MDINRLWWAGIRRALCCLCQSCSFAKQKWYFNTWALTVAHNTASFAQDAYIWYIENVFRRNITASSLAVLNCSWTILGVVCVLKAWTIQTLWLHCLGYVMNEMGNRMSFWSLFSSALFQCCNTEGLLIGPWFPEYTARDGEMVRGRCSLPRDTWAKRRYYFYLRRWHIFIMNCWFAPTPAPLITWDT